MSIKINVKKTLISLLMILILGSIFGYYFYMNYKDDRTLYDELPRGIMSFRTLTTKLSVERVNLDLINHLRGHISKCRYFPNSLKDIFDEKNIPDRRGCSSLKTAGEPWLNPWGHPYEIRYDRERKKIQLRSLGRYWWWPWDNIQKETYFDGKLYDSQVEYCNKVSGSDMNCVFNRGWH